MSWLNKSLYIRHEIVNKTSDKLPVDFQINEEVWLHLSYSDDDGSNTLHILPGIIAGIKISADKVVTYDVFFKIEGSPIYSRIKDISANLTKAGYLLDGSRYIPTMEANKNAISTFD